MRAQQRVEYPRDLVHVLDVMREPRDEPAGREEGLDFTLLQECIQFLVHQLYDCHQNAHGLAHRVEVRRHVVRQISMTHGLGQSEGQVVLL